MFFFLKALSVKVNGEGTGVFPPSLSLAVGLIGTFPSRGPAPQRERTKGSKGWGLPSQSAASWRGAGVVPGKPCSVGVFKVGQGVGKPHSCVALSQFQVK